MNIRTRHKAIFLLLSLLTVVFFILDLTWGSKAISLGEIWASLTGGEVDASTEKIVIHVRLVKAIVALLAGMALTVSGSQMQTLFRNPLAGPYVLGISSGASLGVAVFMLGAPLFGFSGGLSALGTAGAAWLGAAAVLIIVSLAAAKVRNILVVLVLGMMFASGVGAVVQILQYLANEEALKTYVIWTMGSLGDVTASQLIIMTPSIVAGLIIATVCIKPLNLLHFGEDYARSMGLNPGTSRGLLFLSTTLLAGTATAFCGPIGFIGLAMPHVTRMLFRTSEHRILLPGNILVGAAVMLLCDILSKTSAVPINAITALLGIPIVIVIVLRTKM